MSIKITIDTADELHFVFTSTIHSIMKKFSGDKFDSDVMYNVVDTMNSNKWDIVIGGIFAKQLYNNACSIADNYNGDTIPEKSPISVLLKWANTSRFNKQESEGPAKVAEILMMSVSAKDDTIKSYFETGENWNDVIENYNIFLDESSDMININ